MAKNSELTDEDINAQEAAAIPNKEAMSLLDINADVDLALDVAAPIDAAVAANANVAAPIDASVSANALSPESIASASTHQDSVVIQDLHGVADATADQTSGIDQAAGA
jgi:hypothetical protein